jgi:hypothetical protein
VLIISLFTIAKLWNQPRCSTINEWVKKIWYKYTMEYYSASGVLFICRKMDIAGDHQIEQNKPSYKPNIACFDLLNLDQ